MSELHVDGWVVAHVELTGAWTRSADLPDTCWLFRTQAGWTFLTMHQEVRYGDNDEPIGGRASVASTDFATLDDLARHLENYYAASAWVELLDAGHQHDAELFRPLRNNGTRSGARPR